RLHRSVTLFLCCNHRAVRTRCASTQCVVESCARRHAAEVLPPGVTPRIERRASRPAAGAGPPWRPAVYPELTHYSAVGAQRLSVLARTMLYVSRGYGVVIQGSKVSADGTSSTSITEGEPLVGTGGRHPGDGSQSLHLHRRHESPGSPPTQTPNVAVA